MKTTAILSPFSGDVEGNLAYLKDCLLDCFGRGEFPFAPHAIYPQVLDDADPEERRLGMQAGTEWDRKADVIAAYIDRGFSRGMRAEIDALGRNVALRSLERDISEFNRVSADVIAKSLRRMSHHANFGAVKALRLAFASTSLDPDIYFSRNPVAIAAEMRHAITVDVARACFLDLESLSLSPEANGAATDCYRVWRERIRFDVREAQRGATLGFDETMLVEGFARTLEQVER